MSKIENKVISLPTAQALYSQYVVAQGLTPEQLAANHLRLVEANTDLQREVGIDNSLCPALLIPYHAPDSTVLPLSNARCRLLKPRDAQKYWQQKGSGELGPFFPQGRHDWASVLANVAQPLLVVEGEIKAIVSSDYLAALPILAIGGVWMYKSLLNRTDIEWRGRPVIVCFDHDEGQEPGSYKPQVELALSKFCEALMMRGAVVKVVHIGVLAERQGIREKVGLDDYFRKGGKADLILDNLCEPPKGCEMLAAMFDRYVVVTLPRPVVWDEPTGRSYTFSSFHEVNTNKFKLELGTGRIPRKVRVSNEFLERHDRPEATDFVMDPRKPAGYLPEHRIINTWQPFRTFDPELVREDYKQAFGRLVKTMAGEFPKEVAQWIAHYVRRPWERTSQGVLVATSHMGIGKSLLGEIIGHMVGSPHYVEADDEALKSRFNENLEGKTWMIWNEVDIRFGASESWFRNLFSQEKVRIEVKGGACYEVANLRRYWMSSNMAVAIRIGQAPPSCPVPRPANTNILQGGPRPTWLRGIHICRSTRLAQ